VASTPRRAAIIGFHLGFLVAMAFGALLARAFILSQASGYAPWYPPAGILLAYLVIAGWRWLPVAVVGRILAAAISQRGPVDEGAVGLFLRAVVVVLIYSVVATVLRRTRIDRLGVSETALFMAVGVVIGPAVATLAFTGIDLWVRGSATGDLDVVFRTFWVGDAVAIATVVPAAVAFWHWFRTGRPSLNRPIEPESSQIALALALVGVPIVAFVLSGDLAPFWPLALLPVLWVAFRTEPVAATAGLLVTNVMTALVIRSGLGPSLSLLQAQMLMLSASSAGLAILAISTDQRRRMSEVLAREERYATLVEHSPARVIRFDDHGRALPIGEAPPDDVLTNLSSRWEAFGPQTLESGDAMVLPWMLEAQAGKRFFVTNIAREPATDEGGPSVLTVTSDVTASQKSEAEFSMRLRSDVLTGLANLSHVTELIESGLTDGSPLGVAVVDLDQFRRVNQRMGYLTGDRILQDVGNRLAASVRDGDVVGRGSDEFLVVLSAPIGPSDAGRVMDRILRQVHDAGTLHEVPLTASIGLAFADPAAGPPLTARQLIAEAKAAMAMRQSGGGDGWTLVDDELRSRLGPSRRLAAELGTAMERGELHLAYQPVVDLTDGTVTGFEALVRWTRPDGEPVPPQVFIPLAERVGLIGAITDWVVGEAVAQMGRWAGQGARDVTVSVNVSSTDLLDGDFPARLLQRVADAGVEPARIRLELTETAVMTDPDRAVRVLRGLREAGITIALDDFGTGYASLALLRQLPVDVMKIDRSFVSGLPDAADAAVVRLIVGMAEVLDVGVVAEGIETPQHVEMLLAAGCRLGQGYLFAHPSPSAAMDQAIVEAEQAWRSKVGAPG